MKIQRFIPIIVSLLVAAMFVPVTAAAKQPDVTVEEPADAPKIPESKRKGQWFRDMANQSDVKYVFIGRPRPGQASILGIPIGVEQRVDLIEIVSSETSATGRNIIRQFADRLMSAYPLEIAYQARDEDDGSLITIAIVTKPDEPDIATDILIYKWSKTFEAALVHLSGVFDISKAAWEIFR